MANFLSVAWERGIYRPQQEHRELATMGKRYFGSETAVNIETLAAFLALESPPYPLKESRGVAYDQLVGIIEATLGDVHSNPRDVETQELFGQFAELLVTRGISVISLNYDLLLDELLRKTGRWVPYYGYGATLRLAMGPPDSLASLSNVLARSGSIALLKLHGSLNWGRRTLPYEDGSQPVELSTFGALPDVPGPVLPMRGSVVASGKLGTNYNWETFIVPPMTMKSSVYENDPLILNIWHQARWLLSQSSVIHVLGYSLPPADFQVEILLAKGSSRFSRQSQSDW